jgi:hypothetical protein
LILTTTILYWFSFTHIAFQLVKCCVHNLLRYII